MRTMIERARDQLERTCEELDLYCFSYFDDIPLKLVLSDAKGNTATFIMDEDSTDIKPIFDWSKDCPLPDHMSIIEIVRGYMIAFTIDFALSMVINGNAPARSKIGSRITEIW